MHTFSSDPATKHQKIQLVDRFKHAKKPVIVVSGRILYKHSYLIFVVRVQLTPTYFKQMIYSYITHILKAGNSLNLVFENI